MRSASWFRATCRSERLTRNAAAPNAASAARPIDSRTQRDRIRGVLKDALRPAQSTTIRALRLWTKDGVVGKSDAVESLQHGPGGLLIEIFGLELDLHISFKSCRHTRIRQRRLVHCQAVLAPRGPHVDEHRLPLPCGGVEAFAERSVPAGLHLFLYARR